MKVISPNELAKTAAQRWREAYFKNYAKPLFPGAGGAKGETWYSSEMKDVYDKLVALGPAPRAVDVDAAIGNTSWTQYSCNERGCDRVADVEVGEEPDYESSTARLCSQCLQKAVELLTPYPKA